MVSWSANRCQWWHVCERATNGLNWDRPTSMSQPQSIDLLQWHNILAIHHKSPIQRRWFHVSNYDGIFVKSCHHWFGLDRVFAGPNDVCFRYYFKWKIIRFMVRISIFRWLNWWKKLWCKPSGQKNPLSRIVNGHCGRLKITMSTRPSCISCNTRWLTIIKCFCKRRHFFFVFQYF